MMRPADCHTDRPHYAFGLCRSCWAKQRRQAAAKPRSKYEPIQHGTAKGYQRHRYRGDARCGPCWRAWRDDNRRRRNSRTSDIPRMAQTIVDVLITHDRWMTVQVLESLVCDLHPEWKPESVRRKVYELSALGVLESRVRGHSELRNGRLVTVDVADFRACDDAWESVA